MSGTDFRRPALQRLPSEAKKHQFESVIVIDIDRLDRVTLDYLVIKKELADCGVQIISVNQPMINGTPEGQFMEEILAASNSLLPRITGRKAKATMVEKAKMGWYPSYAPVGYLNAKNPNPTCRADGNIIVPDPDREPVIKEMFKRYSTGSYSIYNLQQWLNDINFKTRTGKEVAHSTIGRILTNPFYYGVFEWNKMKTEGKHKPLIDKETFDLCQYAAASHRNFTTRERKHDFLLRGFVFCKACGLRYTAEWHPVKSPKMVKIAYYHCTKIGGCSQPYIEMANLETQVEDYLKDLQFSQKFIELVTKKVQKVFNEGRDVVERQKRSFINQRIGWEKKRSELEDKLMDDTLDRETFKRMHTNLQSKIEGLQTQIEELDRKHNFDVNLVEEVLSFTRNIYQTYKSAPAFLKKHYLRFFYEKLLVENKRICEAQISPFFAALQQENAVIIRSNWLRRWDSDPQPFA